MKAAWSVVGLIAVVLFAGPVVAHDGVKHNSAENAAKHRAAVDPPAPDTEPFPFVFGGAFTLIDQTGAVRTQADPDGRMQLVFFGYANCPAICSTALPTMAEIAAASTASGVPVTAVMITVDPARDTVEGMAAPLAELSPDIIGLTGTEDDLAAVRKLFRVQRKHIFDDPEYGPIFSHGSHIYLMDGAGRFKTLLPPITSPERGVEIVAKYADAAEK
jgi:protein SCO1/2